MKKLFLLFVGFLLIGLLTSSANAYTLYETNFDDGNLADWSPIETPSRWSIVEGFLQNDNTGGFGASEIRLNAVTLPTSYVLEFDTRTLYDGGGASVTAFYTHWYDFSPGNAISHHNRPGRFGINETIGGAWVFDYWSSQGGNIDTSVWQHMKLTVDDVHVTFEYAGQLIYDVILPISITDGYFLLAGCYGGLHQFDNVHIEVAGEPPIPPNPVPEPATMLLLASGLVGLAGLRKKFKK